MTQTLAITIDEAKVTLECIHRVARAQTRCYPNEGDCNTRFSPSSLACPLCKRIRRYLKEAQ